MNAERQKDVLIYKLILGSAMALLSGCASQQAASYAAVLGFGFSDTEYKDLSLFQGNQDRKDSGWKLHGKYDPGQREKIVIEGGYQRMGDATFDGTFQGTPDMGTIETEAIELNVGYRHPITDQLSVGGRVGLASVDVEEREVFGGTPLSSSASETVGYAGVVLRFGINEKWGLSASYDRYLDVGKVGATGEGDIDVFGVSAEFRFGGSNSDD